MRDTTARHEQIVPWHREDETHQLYLVTSFLFHEGQEVGTVIVFSDITELAELKVRYAQDIEELLDSLVKALSTAIDERSHYNANHTRNMVKMAEASLDSMVRDDALDGEMLAEFRKSGTWKQVCSREAGNRTVYNPVKS